MKIEDFHFVLSGNENGPWLIFLHGLLGAAANWRRIIPAFESEFHVLGLDQRGHGKSFKPALGYSPEDFAADLKFVMDSLKIQKASVVGHSMGGRNAFCFASLYGDRVHRLVVEDIGPEPSDANGSGLLRKLKKVPVPFSDKRAAKEYLLNEFEDTKIGNFLYNSITTNEKGQAVWSFDLDMVVQIISEGRGKDRWPEIEALAMPTLVIRGQETNELTQDEFTRMQKCNPLVKGIEVPGAGHWVHFDKPQEFIKIVKDFLNQP